MVLITPLLFLQQVKMCVKKCFLLLKVNLNTQYQCRFSQKLIINLKKNQQKLSLSFTSRHRQILDYMILII